MTHTILKKWNKEAIYAAIIFAVALLILWPIKFYVSLGTVYVFWTVRSVAVLLNILAVYFSIKALRKNHTEYRGKWLAILILILSGLWLIAFILANTLYVP
jgi:protein-S-isoprenylcysteine O-methyltransferase Ste14